MGQGAQGAGEMTACNPDLAQGQGGDTTDLIGAFDDGLELFEGENPTEACKATLDFCRNFEEAGFRTQALGEVQRCDLIADEILAGQHHGVAPGHAEPGHPRRAEAVAGHGEVREDGAYVDSGTMVDTWATVGSCAQIGKNCHISGGAGIGGVLEPVQAAPCIVEDDCFIGARSEIAEGVGGIEGSSGSSRLEFEAGSGGAPNRPDETWTFCSGVSLAWAIAVIT